MNDARIPLTPVYSEQEHEIDLSEDDVIEDADISPHTIQLTQYDCSDD